MNANSSPEFGTEYDGSLVVRNCVVRQPDAEFTKADIAKLVLRANEHDALVATLENALRMFYRKDDEDDRVMAKEVDAMQSEIIDILNRVQPCQP
jgi:hypothetical protein